MKNYIIAAINKNTKVVEHMGTSDLPFQINPFEDLIETHDFEEYEFDADQLVRAKEIINQTNITPRGLTIADDRIKNLGKRNI